ncbi:hypothetical protein H4J58_18535 [Colwellia sp. MB3u-70]|uniref:hypothetical protein n=1 Tax=unclassified Colwellia TaxID=196834 RepID=UPI0015F39590|nr:MULTISPECIES: hypothetical protein [unclassified Colwellia]MBA6292121.1 hypothetical protein [Colwellia sp. MB3u-8]MBA6309104.1 hypothetical protein [Colwellia sp. MB3u-70]
MDVLNIDWSDFSLAPGDRRIKGTGFVVANWSESSDDIGLYFGVLGVLGVIASDFSNEKNLQGSLEVQLKDNFDLAKTLLKSLNNNQDLTAEIKSIHLNSNIKKQVITLEPWCIIFTNEKGLIFLPQLKATLRSETGKALWEGNYGPLSKNKPFKLNNSMTSDHVIELQARLAVVYEEITNQLVANIQGQDSYVNEEESQKFTDDLMKKMEIEFDDSLLNKKLNKDK